MHAAQCSYAIMVLAFGGRWAHCCVVGGNHAIDDASGAKTMTNEEFAKRFASLGLSEEGKATMRELIERNEALEAFAKAANQPKALTLKVSEKGALSIYGLGRFPVTLYRGQWERLLAATDAIRAFMTANAALLATKD